ncbi:hypothetical protein COOONC_05161 [Cooperia oncophora]
MNERLRRAIGTIDRMPRKDRRRHVQLIIQGILQDANCWAVIMNERLRRAIGTIDRMPRKDRRRHVQLIIQGILQVVDDWQSFYEMILLLEWTSNEYPTDPFCKLVLCRAYSHIGRFNVGIVHYTEMVDVYEQAEKEISEALIGAYRNGAFMQVPNLVALANKMKRSAMSIASNELHRYLSALFAIDNIDEAVKWDLLCDNRDLTVIPSFEKNIEKDIESIRASTQKEFVDFARLRHYISQAIGSAGGAKGAGPEELGADLTLLRAHYENCQNTYDGDFPHSRVMQSPSSLYLSRWVRGGFVDPIVCLLQSALEVSVFRFVRKSETSVFVVIFRRRGL